MLMPQLRRLLSAHLPRRRRRVVLWLRHVLDVGAWI
jgi:hypothetical protein